MSRLHAPVVLILGLLAGACAPPADPAANKPATVDLVAEEEVDLTSTDFSEEPIESVDLPGVDIQDDDPPEPP